MRRARLDALIATAALGALGPLARLGVAAPGVAEAAAAAATPAAASNTGNTASAGTAGAAPRAPTRPSPWHDARPGAAITYRLSEPLASGGARTRRVAIVTEEVVGADTNSVSVRVTRREDGVPDRVVTRTYPRELTASRHAQFLASLGPRRDTTTRVVSGRKLACAVHRSESAGGDPRGRLVVSTTLCRGLPGWIHAQSVGRAADPALAPRFELLDFAPGGP